MRLAAAPRSPFVSTIAVIQIGFLSLVAGAMITVGVAWGCLLWFPGTNPSSKSRFVAGGYRVTDAMSRYGAFDGYAVWELRGVGWEMEGAIASYRRLHYADPKNANKLTLVYAGWPWRCLRGERRVLAAQTTDWRLTTLPKLPWSNPTTRSCAPLAPLWPGFMANTAAYGFTAFALVLAFRAAKRGHRLRRRRCPVCGYMLSGLAPLDGRIQCPECGGQVTTPNKLS